MPISSPQVVQGPQRQKPFDMGDVFQLLGQQQYLAEQQRQFDLGHSKQIFIELATLAEKYTKGGAMGFMEKNTSMLASLMPVEGMDAKEVEKSIKTYLDTAEPNFKKKVEMIYEGVFGFNGDQYVQQMVVQAQGGAPQAGAGQQQMAQQQQAAPQVPMQEQPPQAPVPPKMGEVPMPGAWDEGRPGVFMPDLQAIQGMSNGQPPTTNWLAEHMVRSILPKATPEEVQQYQEAFRKKNLPAFKKKWDSMGKEWKAKYGMTGIAAEDPRAWEASGLLLKEVEFPPVPGTGDYNVTDPDMPKINQAYNEKVLDRITPDKSLEARTEEVKKLKYPKGWVNKLDHFRGLGEDPEVANRIFSLLGGGDPKAGFQAVTDLYMETPSRQARISMEGQMERMQLQLDNIGDRMGDILGWAQLEETKRGHDIDKEWHTLSLNTDVSMFLAKQAAAEGSRIDKMIVDGAKELGVYAEEYGVDFTDPKSIANARRKHPAFRLAWDAMAGALAQKEGIPVQDVELMWQEHLWILPKAINWLSFGILAKPQQQKSVTVPYLKGQTPESEVVIPEPGEESGASKRVLERFQ